MEFLILLAVATATVWGLVLVQRLSRSRLRMLPMLGALVIVTGCVVGHDFFHLQVGPLPITIDRMLLLSLLVGFGIQFLREHEHVRNLNRIDLVILATMGTLFLSILLHDWTFKNNLPVSRFLFFYLVPLALYFVMRFVNIGGLELRWITFALAGLAVYLALTAIAETRGLKSLVFPSYIMEPGEFYGRGRGPLLNPVINGILQCVGCCCLWMNWKTQSNLGKFWIVGLSLLIVCGVFFTYTRSVWIGFCASAALFIFWPADRQTKGILWIVGMALLIISFPLVGEKIFSFKRDKDVSQTQMEQSAKLRPMFLEVAIRMFQDRPIFGCGFGQYAREKHTYLKVADSSQPLELTRTYMQHNVFLAYLTETGVIGLGLLLAMLGVFAIQGWRLWCNPSHELLVRLYGLALIATLLNYTINGMFHDVSIIPMTNSVLFFMAGIVNNLATSAEEPTLSLRRDVNLTLPSQPSALSNAH